METIRVWLAGVAAAAVLLATADIIMPKGGVRQIGRFAGAAVLILISVRPVLGLDLDDFGSVLTDDWCSTSDCEETLEDTNAEIYKFIIEDKLAAYIQDKAEAEGIVCTAEVVLEYSQSGSISVNEISIIGTWTEEQKMELSRLLESELLVSQEKQHFERSGE